MTLHINRRTALKGAGFKLALPLMESLVPRALAASTATAPARRMAIVSVPFGMVVDQFHPKDTGPDWTLSPTRLVLADAWPIL